MTQEKYSFLQRTCGLSFGHESVVTLDIWKEHPDRHSAVTMTLRLPSTIQEIAPYATLTIQSILAFPSQWLFTKIEPGPLTRNQTIRFNLVVFCLMFCYCRAWLSDPGRVPSDWKLEEVTTDSEAQESADSLTTNSNQRLRWCRRCEAYKPPRAHHCKTCKRCIPKMDHHCPWTCRPPFTPACSVFEAKSSQPIAFLTEPFHISFAFLPFQILTSSGLNTCSSSEGISFGRTDTCPVYFLTPHISCKDFP